MERCTRNVCKLSVALANRSLRPHRIIQRYRQRHGKQTSIRSNPLGSHIRPRSARLKLTRPTQVNSAVSFQVLPPRLISQTAAMMNTIHNARSVPHLRHLLTSTTSACPYPTGTQHGNSLPQKRQKRKNNGWKMDAHHAPLRSAATGATLHHTAHAKPKATTIALRTLETGSRLSTPAAEARASHVEDCTREAAPLSGVITAAPTMTSITPVGQPTSEQRRPMKCISSAKDSDRERIKTCVKRCSNRCNDRHYDRHSDWHNTLHPQSLLLHHHRGRQRIVSVPWNSTS